MFHLAPTPAVIVTPPSSSAVSSAMPTLSHGIAMPRRGKAPPVDTYSGEEAEIRFEDWLPTLNRVATWNHWSDEERLMQLAGYLRGRVLIE